MPCCLQAIKDTVFDEFVIAHTLGWWGKALFLRNNIMLWTIRYLGCNGAFLSPLKTCQPHPPSQPPTQPPSQHAYSIHAP
jgi:hypothetical protein